MISLIYQPEPQDLVRRSAHGDDDLLPNGERDKKAGD
jgi:hypothetical protein